APRGGETSPSRKGSQHALRAKECCWRAGRPRSVGSVAPDSASPGPPRCTVIALARAHAVVHVSMSGPEHRTPEQEAGFARRLAPGRRRNGALGWTLEACRELYAPSAHLAGGFPAITSSLQRLASLLPPDRILRDPAQLAAYASDGLTAFEHRP